MPAATPTSLVPPRSYLYVPGHRPDRLAKALDRCGDAMIADLEDAVPAASKEDARRSVAEWLTGVVAPRAQIWVRLNSGVDMLRDVSDVLHPVLTGVIVAKAELDPVKRVAAELDRQEQARGVEPGSTRIAALIETARGHQQAAELATLPRVSHLGIGEADLSAELGLSRDLDPGVLAALRLPLVIASAAARKWPPCGPVHTAVRDLDALAADTAALVSLGFVARSAIHPDQVPVIESAFTPSEAETAQARQLVAAFDAAGGGGAVDDQGRFIDEAVVRSARRVVALADRSS